jgi:hypothetical protein
MTWENPTAIEGRVGIAIETTEGTAEAEPSIELFVNSGSAPELDLTPDTKIKNKAYNEPYKRSEERGYWHTEGNLPGMKFSPSNGIPEFLEVGFGNDWYSKPVYKYIVASGGGTSFTRGDKVFGRTSLARGEVARVVTDTLWLTGVQGTFANSEDLLKAPGGIDYKINAHGTSGFGAVASYYCHKLDAVRNFSQTDTPATLTTAKAGNKDLTFKALVDGDAGEAISITCVVAGANTAFSISVSGNDITINSATDGDSLATSLASAILTALNADAAANLLIYTALADGSSGVGIFGALTHTHLTHARTPVRVGSVATKACLGDPMVDFSEYGVTATSKKKVFVTVKDATATPIPISGWMGAPCMLVTFDTGSAVFTVGQKLSAKTGAGDAVVIGTIIDFVVTENAGWGGTTKGYLFVEQDATARTIIDNDVLTSAVSGAAVADVATIPAYLNSAVQIYDIPDDSGYAKSWNGDVATFDETDSLTYDAVQRTFDQKSLSVFIKDAGDATKVGNGVKIKEIAFDITADSYAYNVGLLGRNISYPTTEPAYPGGITDSAAFGSSSRTFEIDGSTSGQAAQVNRARFSATWDFAPAKGVVISENYPTTLQPTTYNIIGTLDLQWKSNAMLKAFWNNPSGIVPAAGELITKRLAFLLDSGEVVTTGYNKILSIEVLGTIDSATLNRDADGYIQPVTIEGFMMDDTYIFGPARFYLFDNVATH